MHRDDLEAMTIGDFRIEKRIGAGGMGVVYQARQLSLDRVVALKVLGQALTSPAAIARFRREAQAAAKLQHPAIAAIHYIGQESGICFMAMEYITGASIRTVIERLAFTTSADSSVDTVAQSDAAPDAPKIRFDESTVGCDPTPDEPSRLAQGLPLSSQAKQRIGAASHIRRCCELVRDAAAALAHAHERGVVHRDLKPENLMLDRSGRIHIIDFGIARFFEDATLTQTGQLVGTPMYMSPEQVTGRLDVDHRTDIYSLGLVLYELLTLQRVITSPSREGVLRMIVTKSLPPVSWQNRAIPQALEGVIHKATAKDPDDRYQSAAELAADLERFLTGGHVTARPYRYRFDRREIVASRPASVEFLAYLSFVVAVPSISISLIMLYEWQLPTEGALLLAMAAFAGAGGQFLLQGRALSRWLTLAWCALGFRWFVVWGMPELEAFFRAITKTDGSATWILYLLSYGAMILSAQAVVRILFGREMRHWLQLADEIRREHRRNVP